MFQIYVGKDFEVYALLRIFMFRMWWDFWGSPETWCLGRRGAVSEVRWERLFKVDVGFNGSWHRRFWRKPGRWRMCSPGRFYLRELIPAVGRSVDYEWNLGLGDPDRFYRFARCSLLQGRRV